MSAAKLPLSAVILAGGDSKRMGEGKAFLRLKGRPLIELVFEKLDSLFQEVVIVTDRSADFAYLKGAKMTGDILCGEAKNALRGIHAGVFVSSYPSCFVVGCDMPFVSLPLIKHMSNYAMDFDAVVPRLQGHYQPLFAFYNKSALQLITSCLQEQKYKIVALYPYLKMKVIMEDMVRSIDPYLLSFHNINTREAYLEARQRLDPDERESEEWPNSTG